ncbi:MAG: hypothetical protein HYR96_02740 [Deltaproteobacteria bacterium]|nr:hypothetical protein [Deltaproteobacteria bacterium]MBI3294018.1 hypothetical protein [Deltaproteobacteria bacterium]
MKSAIDADLDTAKHGIGWWQGYSALGDKRRIFISDYLLEVVRSIEVNLIEARLHFLELLEWGDTLTVFLANSIVHDQKTGTLRMKHPEHKTPLDELPGEMIGLHEAGVLRSLGSTLDCLGGAIVGVIGLPTPIVRSDLGVVRKKYSNLSAEQTSFLTFLDDTIRNAGPDGWLEWTNDYRNMVVHRARRLRMTLMTPSQQGGQTLAVPIGLMARAPSRTDLEDLEDSSIEPVLTESSGDTIEGLFASATTVTEVISKKLVDVWLLRRKNPQLIEQPRAQWVSLSARGSGGAFRGFHPGTHKYNPSSITGNPALIRRLLVGALDDKNRSKWNSFT